jgi:UDP-N-acetylglucosamine 2-epimerase (non-hydrolysing)
VTNALEPMKHKIHLIAGARPNFMKVAPIMRELKKYSGRFEYRLVHTGQHYDQDMSDVFFKELGIPRPDFHLEVGSGSHAEQTANVMVRYEKVCREDVPDLVMVVGDVNSTLACAVVAKKLSTQVAHVEAGLRSGDRTMPEEINRIVTDSISDHFFVTERSGVDHLLAEGKAPDHIHFVGHVMIDNLFFQLEKLKEMSQSDLATSKLKQRYPDYGVVTLHRPSNVDDAAALRRIVQALEEISSTIPLIFPLHPRTRKNLDLFELRLPASIVTTPPLPYMDFLNLFKDAKLVLTDSGGVQEETTSLGIPCLTLRDNTERPVTVTDGTNVVVGTQGAAIVSAARRALATNADAKPRPDLWDGKAAERICKILDRLAVSSL